MTTIDAIIADPTGVNVTMTITMTLSNWLRLMDDLELGIKAQAPRPKNDYTEELIEAIGAFSSQLGKSSSLYISSGMATVATEPEGPDVY